MLALVRNSLQGMMHETASDVMTIGQRLAGKAITAKQVPFLTADVIVPQPDPTANVDPSVVLTGQIYIRRYADIGPNVVIRGETGVIDIGREAKIGCKFI